jgi:hypothetical protein
MTARPIIIASRMIELEDAPKPFVLLLTAVPLVLPLTATDNPRRESTLTAMNPAKFMRNWSFFVSFSSLVLRIIEYTPKLPIFCRCRMVSQGPPVSNSLHLSSANLRYYLDGLAGMVGVAEEGMIGPVEAVDHSMAVVDTGAVEAA